MAMIHLLDGAKSAFAAVATVAITGLPCWFTAQAILAGIAPPWAWGAEVALGFVGALMTFAFLGKAAGGISPSRDRRRRA